MTSDKRKPIIIKNAHGDNAPPDLLNCYFECVSDEGGFFKYTFFDELGEEIIPHLEVGMQFNFELPHVPHKVWSLSITAGTQKFVTGQWKEGPLPMGEEDGSYQAQAGGTPVEEKTDEATAAAAAAP